MFKFVVLLCAVACALGAAVPEGMVPQLDGRIVGGEVTTIDKFPWQISLQRSGIHYCGGAIYRPNIIVTTASCLQSVTASVLKVRAGSSYWSRDGVLVDVAAFQYHRHYYAIYNLNDIGVIRLASSLTMSSNINTIALATTAPANGAAAVVSGWGTTYSGGSTPDQLNYVNLNVVGNTECASSTYGYGSQIKRWMICGYAVGKGTCQGDSGTPMVSGGVLVGVYSWGNGCAQPNYPGVYTDIAGTSFWISSTADTV